MKVIIFCVFTFFSHGSGTFCIALLSGEHLFDGPAGIPVSQVKETLHERFGIPPSQLTFYIEGRALDENELCPEEHIIAYFSETLGFALQHGKMSFVNKLVTRLSTLDIHKEEAMRVFHFLCMGNDPELQQKIAFLMGWIPRMGEFLHDYLITDPAALTAVLRHVDPTQNLHSFTLKQQLLFNAVFFNCVDNVGIILESRVDLNFVTRIRARDRFETPLDRAVRDGLPEIVRLLLNHGAQPVFP